MIHLSSGDGKTFVGTTWTEERAAEFEKLILRSRQAKVAKRSKKSQLTTSRLTLGSILPGGRPTTEYRV